MGWASVKRRMLDGNSIHSINLERVFTTENCVILSSNIEIDSLQWQMHFRTKWNKLMRPNSKILVLAGIHGCKDGKLGSMDEGLFGEYEHQIEFLKRKHKKDIAKNNIEFVLENVGIHLNEKNLDKKKIIEVIKKHKPTIISLAFCYTNVSVLNDVLRAGGIYTMLILAHDRAVITEDRCLELDEAQRSIIENVAENPTKNVFLWGSSGTGKTIILTEVLKMKASYYKMNGVKLNVLVTSYIATPQSQLIQDLQKKYLAHLPTTVQVQYIALSELCTELGLKFSNEDSQSTINAIIKIIAAFEQKGFHNILLIDEILSINILTANNNLCDWSSLAIPSNIDVLLALNPQGVNFKRKFQIIPPKSKDTISQQLIEKHRNSFECDLLVEHFKSLPKSSYLDNCNDIKLDKLYLPPGREPVWIEEIQEQSIEYILGILKKDHILEHETVTLIYDKFILNEERRIEVDEFCHLNKWSTIHFMDYYGCEDQAIILFEINPLFELISRGRNQIIFVTNHK